MKVGETKKSGRYASPDFFAGERVGAVNSLSASHHIGRQRRPFKEILPYPTFQKRRVCLLCEKQKIGAVLP